MAERQFESLERRVIRTSIDWSGAGQRLDEYLAGRFTYRSLSEWRDRIAAGEIMLNGESPDPSRLLELHDRIEYFPGDLPEPRLRVKGLFHLFVFQQGLHFRHLAFSQ